MVVAPSICCDWDCERADDDRLASTIAAPNPVMAVRLVTGPGDRGWGVGIFECRTIISIRSMSVSGNAGSRWGLRGFSSTAIEAFAGNGVPDCALLPIQQGGPRCRTYRSWRRSPNWWGIPDAPTFCRR